MTPPPALCEIIEALQLCPFDVSATNMFELNQNHLRQVECDPFSFSKILFLSYNLISMIYSLTKTILFVLIFIVSYFRETNRFLNDLFEGEKGSLKV